MSLQDTFYLVGIITMSLLTLLFITLVIIMIYIRIKIGDLVDAVETQVSNVKEAVSHPGRIAATIGDALVSTAADKVSKYAATKKSRRR